MTRPGAAFGGLCTTVSGDRAAVLALGARWGRDESKAYGVDGNASDARQTQVIDWLEQAPDLPLLIARLSELVLRLGHAPDDLVILPRAELDRRALAAYTAGWADVVDEQLPAVRRAYEQRITAAYLQGQEDARTGRRPRREREFGGGGGEVIQLPYVQLLRPPSELTRVEERGERERAVADGPPNQDQDQVEPDPDPDTLVTARDLREKRTAPAERRPVVRRNGRPGVPPLTTGAGREKGRRATESSEGSPFPSSGGGRGERRSRLSAKARALADELEGRAPGRRRDEEPGPVEDPVGRRESAGTLDEGTAAPISRRNGPVGPSTALRPPPLPSSPARFRPASPRPRCPCRRRTTGAVPVPGSGWSPSSELAEANIQLAAARWSTAAASRWSVTDQSAASPCSSRLRALSCGNCRMSTVSRRAESRSRCQSSRSMP